MKAIVEWVGKQRFLGTSESGHNIIFDACKEKSAPSPMETLLMSAGACSSVDVVSILKKSRQQVSQCEVHLAGTRADAVPAVFTSIHLHFVVSGTGISEKHVERAVGLSADKYCSVAIMLSGSVEVTHSFETVEII